MQECIFCKIIAGQIPSVIIAHDDQVIVIKDINPAAPIHYLIIPKKHLQDLTNFSTEDHIIWQSCLLMVQKLAQLQGCQQFKLMSNNGYNAGQRVFHTHIHFLAGLVE
jgi:histidine triad (HIT) family protein